jgi:DNA-binding CsgD family transcriptional regulator
VHYHRVTQALPGAETLAWSEARSVVPVPELSETEERIVLLVAQGRGRQEIAAAAGLDVRTVDWHLAQANRKLEKASALLDRVRGKERSKP